ncbi:MAG TPA: hypothetical protein VIG06_10710 [Kofleriaceae bacterium]|jgi:hypothetical protein
MRKSSRRLALHRETIRNLTGADLRRVVGGELTGTAIEAAVDRLAGPAIDLVTEPQTDPKTNAWTGATPKLVVAQRAFC